jgi:hypothetical protein
MKVTRQTRSSAIRSGVILAALLLSILIFKPLRAQESRATLEGRVTDQQGSIIPRAIVVVTSEQTGVKQQTITNDQGAWTVRFLNPGAYTIAISAPNFRTFERRGITLQVADRKQIDSALELGEVSDHLVVTAEAPLIDTTSATSGTVITSQEISELPSMTRVATLLATLSPGVIAQDQNNNVVHMWSYIGASQFLADGGRDIRSNNFQLDGLPNVKSGGYISFIPPTDSLQEFRVQTNAYDASIGRQAGSTINMTTKSGAKDFHGSLFWFNQNNFLNAALFQTNLTGADKPPVHFNEYGGTFGGPVWIPKVYNGRQKTFFFFSFDGTRNEDPRPGSIRSVPTELERKGDFSQSFTTNLINGQLVKFPIQIFDPLTVNAAGVRQPFAGNVIPAGRLSPITQAILQHVPLPNKASDPTGNAVNNFISSATRKDTLPVISIRVDQAWNNSHHSFVSVRWNHLTEFLDDYFNSPATGNYQTRIAKGIGLDHVWTIGPTKSLDLRFNVSRFKESNFNKGAGFVPTQLGFPASFVSQMVEPSFPRITGFAGDFGTDNAGSYTFNTYYTWSANLTHIHGAHMMRYGGEYWVLQQASGGIGNQGQFDFNGNWTRQQATVGGGVGNGSTFASFLLGLPSGGNFPSNATAFYSQRFTALYFQDDWRVTKKLTLNLGLRWDYERPVTERYNRLTSNFDPTVVNPISDQAQAAYAKILAANANNAIVQQLAQIVPASAFKVYGAQLFAGVNGQSSTVVNGDYHEWQPRVGFAYQIRPNTVIRGGFGRFTQATFQTGGQNGFSRSTPLIATQDNFFTPYDTLANPFHSGILAPTGSSLGPMTNLGQGVQWFNQDPTRAYSLEYSLHLQQQYKSWLFEIGYSHNKTYGIFWPLNQNNPSFSLWQQLRAPRFDANGRPLDKLLWDELVPNPFNKLPGISGGIGSAAQVAFSQLIRPINILGDQNRNDNAWGKNQYDAMLAKVERRFGGGFSVITAFTWSKLFEDTSFWGPEISGPITEHKLGGEDRPFHLSVAPIWELPFGRGKKWGVAMPKFADVIMGGWELAGQYNIQSGTPVVFGTDSFYDGKDFSLPRDERMLDRWFDTSHFIRFPDRNTDISNYPAWTGIQNLPGYNYKPAPNDTIKNGVYQDFGNYVRRYPTRWGNVRASRVNELNLGLYKNFKLVEKVKVQFRFEAFNAFNHPRFGAPNTNPASSNFGRVDPVQLNNARQIQMALKVSF